MHPHVCTCTMSCTCTCTCIYQVQVQPQEVTSYHTSLCHDHNSYGISTRCSLDPTLEWIGYTLMWCLKPVEHISHMLCKEANVFHPCYEGLSRCIAVYLTIFLCFSVECYRSKELIICFSKAVQSTSHCWRCNS